MKRIFTDKHGFREKKSAPIRTDLRYPRPILGIAERTPGLLRLRPSFSAHHPLPRPSISKFPLDKW
jgi:hypothetical protein